MIPRTLPAMMPLLVVVLLASGCWLVADPENHEPIDDGVQVAEDPGGLLSVAELRALMYDTRRDSMRGQEIEVRAYVTEPATQSDGGRTPLPGCPIVPASLAWLSDVPITTQYQVAGVTLPNRLPDDVAGMRLVVPYRLGFVRVPDHATLRGRVLDETYAQCPDADTLFILDEVVDQHDPPPALPTTSTPETWEAWSGSEEDMSIEFPAGWGLEERRGAGAAVRVVFRRPEGDDTVLLTITHGETHWQPDTGAMPPEPLRGARQAPVMAGPHIARLVDVLDGVGAGYREARVVLNHAGNTIVLSFRYRDGAELDRDGLAVFESMVARMVLHGDVAVTDPMDPGMAASDEIGDGPFISEADARYLAGIVSGLSGYDPVEARLVPESEARRAVPGACANFEGQPEGVWLVTIRGQSPAGQTVQRLVYLDATTGSRLCQAETSQ